MTKLLQQLLHQKQLGPDKIDRSGNKRDTSHARSSPINGQEPSP
jgi:hypothetical protein